jgi:hypothetical protein
MGADDPKWILLMASGRIAMATNPATPTERMTGVGLAGGLVISALLDTLHAKGILTLEESRNVLDAALASIGPCAESREGFEATQVIGLLRARFSSTECLPRQGAMANSSPTRSMARSTS